MREVLGRLQTSFVVEGRELTPAQLLERLGFGAPASFGTGSELSGGQRRRLQLMLILLAEPNVLILDEPTNDVDTDMLTATGGSARLVAGHADRRLPRPVSASSASPISSTRFWTGGCGTCPAASTSTCGWPHNR